MNSGIFFAFACLVSAACNDLLFKFFARRPRPRGIFITIIGIVWSALALLLPGKFDQALSQTIIWGVISGIFSTVANIFLIEAMTRQSAGLCSTIYRLNLALVIPGAALLFHEQHPWYQYLGIAAALLAVLFFLPGSTKSGDDSKNDRSGLIMIITAAVLRALMGLSYKYGFNHGATPNGITLINGFCWIIGGAIYFLLCERAKWANSAEKLCDGKLISYGAGSGILVIAIVYTMAQAVKLGDVGIVLPIAQMSFILTFILSMIFLREKLTLYKFFALFCGAAALILLSLN